MNDDSSPCSTCPTSQHKVRPCYRRVLFQLVSPPGFHVTHISKGNLVKYLQGNRHVHYTWTI